MTKFTEKLKKWRHDHQEQYAKTIIEMPKEMQLYSMLPFPGVVLVMGDRRMGKTALRMRVQTKCTSAEGCRRLSTCPMCRRTSGAVSSATCPIG